MKIFDIDDENKVIVSPEVRVVPEFAHILKRDKDRFKKQAFKEFAFIYFMADYRSVYNDLPEEEKYQKIRKDYLDEEFGIDDSILKAIEKYKMLQETTTMKMLKAARVACQKLEEYFLTVDLNERDDSGKVVNKSTDLAANIKAIGAINDSLNKVEAQIKKEQASGERFRGGAIINPREE